jgi:hypothetical protein
VETATVGLCAGVRKLPSQVYERDIFFYNPESLPKDGVIKNEHWLPFGASNGGLLAVDFQDSGR